MNQVQRIILLIASIILTVSFVGSVGYFISQANNQVQSGIQTASQTLFGNSPTVTKTTVVGGIPTTTASPPAITSVSFGTNSWSPTITINGYNFGSNATVTEISDGSNGWGLGGVQPTITSQNNDEIQISNLFNGGTPYGYGDNITWADGQGSFSFRPGDQIQIGVTDSQGQVTTFNTSYPSSATMPSTTINASSTTINAGQSATISGIVSFNGNPIPYSQAVVVTTNGGTLQGTPVSSTSNYMVFTSSSTCQWSIGYTAPLTAGTYAITASIAGQQTAINITVLPL